MHETKLSAFAETNAFGILGIETFAPRLMEAMHWHGHIEANYCANGRLDYAFQGADIEVPANRTVLFWAGIPHRLNAVERTQDREPLLTNLYLPLERFLAIPNLGSLQIALLAGGMLVLPDKILTHDQLVQWRGDLESGDSDLIDILMLELTANLRRLARSPFVYLHQPDDRTQPAKTSKARQVRPVVEMIRFVLENLDKPLTSAAIAAVTELHVNYALTLFSRAMHISLGQFVIRMRLLRARSLLVETDRAIASIAHDCGFQSGSQFYHHFTKLFRETPGRIRHAAMHRTPAAIPSPATE